MAKRNKKQPYENQKWHESSAYNKNNVYEPKKKHKFNPYSKKENDMYAL